MLSDYDELAAADSLFQRYSNIILSLMDQLLFPFFVALSQTAVQPEHSQLGLETD